MKYLFSNIKINIIIFIISLSIYILCLLGAVAVSATKDSRPIRLTIANPYFLGLEAKVTCDWNDETEEHAFERTYIIKGKSSTTLSFPSNVKDCSLSPRILW